MSAPAPVPLLGEIESPRPLHAPGGRMELTGWCLADGQAALPELRLRLGEQTFSVTRTPRPELVAALPGQPAAAHSGFRFAGHVPAGIHLVRLDARPTGGEWQTFRTLTLAADATPFQGAVDTPVDHGTLHDRVKVGGWTADATHRLRRLVLRYGHREIECRTGLPRTDVPAFAPGQTAPAHAGFESADFLVAGHGPVRLKAWLDDDSVRIVPTPVTFSIAEDENHPRELQLGAPRIALPGYERHATAPTTPTAHPQRILFLLYGNFTSNSALQVCAQANALAAAGHTCTVAVPDDLDTIRHQDTPRFRAVTHADAIATGGFADGRGPDIIHAWTTREHVRTTALAIQRRHGGRLVIQLEDNEHEILAQTLGRPYAELAALSEAELGPLLPPDLSHPHRSREFLAAAAGVTVIIDRLRDFVPAGKPCATIWPAADARYFFPRPRPDEFRRLLDPSPDTTTLFYPGNAHAANAAEMRALYEAVARLNAAGQPTVLIRAGIDRVDFLGALAAEVRPHVLELGQLLNHRHLPPLFALADFLVQPGVPDAFNDYRFPSKLPEFFALGRPVILPRSNLGLHVRHGLDAYVLDRADATGLAAAVTELRGDPALAARLAAGATAFAEKNFSWARSAEALAKFYASLTPS